MLNPIPERQWDTRRAEKRRRQALGASIATGKVIPTGDIVAFLEAVTAPGDRVVLEGNNQKQADFLSRALADADPARLHDLHMIIPSVSRVEHLDLFERGIARKLDFAYAGAQSVRISQFLADGLLEIGAPLPEPPLAGVASMTTLASASWGRTGRTRGSSIRLNDRELDVRFDSGVLISSPHIAQNCSSPELLARQEEQMRVVINVPSR